MPIALALATAAPTFADTCPAVTGDQAAVDVRASFDEWNEAVMHKDLDKTMAIFSQNIHFQFQGSPDFGFARLNEIYASGFARENAPVWHPIVENVIASPGMVTLFNEWKLIPAGGGNPIKEYRGVDVFQREADCVWRVTASLNYADKSVAEVGPNPPGGSIGPAEVNADRSEPLIAARDAGRLPTHGGPR
jgi:ketosteroid isomerase-like protein